MRSNPVANEEYVRHEIAAMTASTTACGDARSASDRPSCRRVRDGFLDDGTFELRREHLDERVHVAPKVMIAANADMYRVGLEEMARIDRAQPRVARSLVGHVG